MKERLFLVVEEKSIIYLKSNVFLIQEEIEKEFYK